MLLKRGAGSGEPPREGGGVPYESGGDAGRLA